MAGKPWYNNGQIEIQRGVNEIIPAGFVRGRLPLTDTALQNRRLAQLNRTPEEKEITNKKRSQSLKNTFANKSQVEKDLTIQKRKETWNNKSEEEILAYRKKLSDSTKGKNLGKIPWNKGLTKETDERVANQSILSKNGMERYISNKRLEDPEYYNRWRSSINNVMRSNGSFNRSLPEDKYYEKLITKYGEDGVIRWYYDERYPFICDFYIPSEDLFIELNKHWTHGGHPFDELNLNDISKLEDWQEKAETSKYYKNAIYTWTILDVKKQEYAKKNHLNYKVIY